MTIKFWKNFSKRINSTKQPTTAADAELTCYLKENTSIHDPVIKIASAEYGYEYAYIETFGKYYFVRDVVSAGNNLIEYHLTEDPMATYKTAIGSTRAHIAFSTTGYDAKVIDPRIIVSTSKQISKTGGTNSELVFNPSSDGYYILSVFNNSADTTDNGIASCYAISPTDMIAIRSFLCRGDVLRSINDYIYGEPLKAVFNCIWVPYDNFSGYTRVLSISIGNQSTTPGDLLSTYALPTNPKITNTISVTCHLRYTGFRKGEPYTTGNIYLPGVGVVNLNMSDWINSTKIHVQYTIEVITGNMRYFLKDDNGNIIQTHDCCVASPCPLGQEVLNGSGVIGGLAATVGGAASLIAGIASGGSGTVIAGSALAMTMGAANTVLSANKRDVMTTGNIGGRMIQTQPAIIHTEFSVDSENPIDADYIAERGGAYMGTATISSLSGYVQCEGASINCSASALEKEEINNFLNSGFYYE